jgi:acyl carrier protein
MMEVDAELDRKIIGIISEGVVGKFQKTKITLETHLQKELGLDSIGILALVFRFEESFSIDIAQLGIEIDVAKLKTVGDVVNAAHNILNKALVARQV